MASISITTVKPGLTARVEAWIDAKRAQYAQYRIYRRTVDELSVLSDRDLIDLGIGRGEIKAIALDTAYGPSA